MSDRRKKIELEVRTHQATREAIDHLAAAFDEWSKESGQTRSELAHALERDPAYLSRVLNGRVSNLTYQTFARLLIAMGYWPHVEARRLEQEGQLSNYAPAHTVSPGITYASPSPFGIEGADKGTLRSSGPQQSWKVTVNA